MRAGIVPEHLALVESRSDVPRIPSARSFSAERFHKNLEEYQRLLSKALNHYHIARLFD
jgi:hypothetical protein